MLGVPLAEIDGDLLIKILPHLDPTAEGMPVAVRCRIGNPSTEYDGLMHRPPEGGLIIELERAGPPIDLSGTLAPALERIRTAARCARCAMTPRCCFSSAPATTG